MGLDISVYTNVSYVSPQPQNEECNSFINLYPHPYFDEQADGLKGGWYEAEEVFSFRAGSYSGYNEWREQLCRMALNVDPEDIWNNPESFKDKPFYYLINFGDNEGIIGPKTSAKLLEDFRDFEEKAKEWKMYSEEELAAILADNREYFRNYFYNKYQEWQKAFEIAATQNGVVELH